MQFPAKQPRLTAYFACATKGTLQLLPLRQLLCYGLSCSRHEAVTRRYHQGRVFMIRKSSSSLNSCTAKPAGGKTAISFSTKLVSHEPQQVKGEVNKDLYAVYAFSSSCSLFSAPPSLVTLPPTPFPGSSKCRSCALLCRFGERFGMDPTKHIAGKYDKQTTGSIAGLKPLELE